MRILANFLMFGWSLYQEGILKNVVSLEISLVRLVAEGTGTIISGRETENLKKKNPWEDLEQRFSFRLGVLSEVMKA